MALIFGPASGGLINAEAAPIAPRRVGANATRDLLVSVCGSMTSWSSLRDDATDSVMWPVMDVTLLQCVLVSTAPDLK